MRNNYYDQGWKWVSDREKEGEPVAPREPKPYGSVYDPRPAEPDGSAREPVSPGAEPHVALPGGPQVPPAPTAAPRNVPPQNVAPRNVPPSPEPVREQVRQVIITSQDQLRITPPIDRAAPKKPKKPRRKSGLPGFLICLGLLLALFGTLLYFQGGVDLSTAWDGILALWQQEYERKNSLPDDFFLPDGDGSFSYEDAGEDWTADLEQTAIRPAPLGDGTVLEICEEAGETLSAEEIYDRVNPSVVAVTVSQGGAYYSMGSGVIFSSDGYIVTNAHVIAGGKSAEVLFADGTTRVASLVGYDANYDLAVLKVTAEDLPVAEFGDSDALRVGELAYAIGNPLGLELRGTLTDGIISAIDRDVSAENGSMTLIQTTAALNSGNSGGALINASGQVIGITNMKMMSSEETIEGLGFAIPSRSVKDVVDQLIARGYYDDGIPLLGITVYTYAGDDQNPAGICIQTVESGSDAYQKGLQSGDIIVGANGQPITTTEELLEIKNAMQAGDVLTLTVWRNGREREVPIMLLTRYQMEHPEVLGPVG